MKSLTYMMFNLGFVLVFTLLGTWMMLHHMPKDKEFKSYRVARYTLGIGFAIMALYCLVRFLPPHSIAEITVISGSI